jgi:hypothetical protein
MSKISDALAQFNNPATSFPNAEHPCSRKEVANILTLLVSNPDSWKDLGANEFEVAQNIGRLIDSFEQPST